MAEEEMLKGYLTSDELADYRHLKSVYSRSGEDPLDQIDAGDAMYDLEELARGRMQAINGPGLSAPVQQNPKDHGAASASVQPHSSAAVNNNQETK